MRLTGHCYCGEVHYRAEGEPLLKGQCHCRECQYFSGGSPNVFIAMPADQFTYTKGTPKSFTRTDLEHPVTREFCPNCGTPLLSRAPGFPAAIIKAGTLDDISQYGTPDLAIFTVDKQIYHHIPDGMPAFERMPG